VSSSIPFPIRFSIVDWIRRWKFVGSGRPFLRVDLIGNPRNFSSDLDGFFLLRNIRTHQPAKRPEKVTAAKTLTREITTVTKVIFEFKFEALKFS
jgi:hypothetical protein